MIPAQKTLQTIPKDLEAVSYVVDIVQANTASRLDRMNQNGLTDGYIVKDIAISTSDTVVEHGLGREPLGWILIDKTADINVYKSTTVNPKKSTILILKASGTGTVSLLVF